MIIWRVEHKTMTMDGRRPVGPYQSSPWMNDNDADIRDFVYEINNAHCDNKHLAPQGDRALVWIRPEEICGFISEKDCKKWFAGWWRRLRKFGWHMVTYDIPEDRVRIGKNGQCVFIP